MGLIVKILIGTALIGAGALGWTTYQYQLLWTQENAAKVVALQQADAANKLAAKNEARAKLAEGQVIELNGTIEGQKQKLGDLQTQLTAAMAKEADLQTASDAKAAQIKDIQAQLDDIKGQLGADTIAGLRSHAETLQQQLSEQETQSKILLDELQRKKQDVVRIQRVINQMTNYDIHMPPLSGKVKFVNPLWSFVVVDAGTNQGVVPKGELSVYRGKLYLGKLKVTSADSDSCVADIEPDIKDTVKVGDDVVSSQ